MHRPAAELSQILLRRHEGVHQKVRVELRPADPVTEILARGHLFAEDRNEANRSSPRDTNGAERQHSCGRVCEAELVSFLPPLVCPLPMHFSDARETQPRDIPAPPFRAAATRCMAGLETRHVKKWVPCPTGVSLGCSRPSENGY